ncbi:DNA/RNA non-specific endonuclease [Magnetospirillum molischianum]|uniref:Nuclease n=1 Tax=Magnetospirillum molischianum DSM 120 TaxID=1150626 RepID=H8FTG6_MAGML|nr:DNA/RNA non-specific endonuclease [Magnetospirillum molischianum]CCG41654.1 Nuclease [Magnetospirillum molischianum DSM 120]
MAILLNRCLHLIHFLRVVLTVATLIFPIAAPAREGPSCRSQSAELDFPYQSNVPTGWDHDRFGTEPPGERQIVTGPFISAFPGPEAERTGSPYRAVPRWVAYEMRALIDDDGQPVHPQGARRPSRWYELHQTSFLWDDRPEIESRGLDSSYRGFAALWNRGHLAARAHANRIAWQEGCNSHVFVNALPQHARLNQGDWLALENYAAAAANRFGRLWTIAGPVFTPGRSIEMIGGPSTVPVPVPHAVFKILAIETEAGIEARAFLFPQAEDEDVAAYRRCSGTQQESYDLGRYAITVARLETLTGLDFFTRLDESSRHAISSSSDAALWPIAPHFYGDRCGGRATTR